MKIEPTEFFIETFQKLDSSERRMVVKTVRKLELSMDWLGKRMHMAIYTTQGHYEPVTRIDFELSIL